jgi:UTP--glucose-1-phosphate uridylyltransferase
MPTTYDLDLDAETTALLQRYGFDGETFAALRARLAAGEAGPGANRIEAPIEPPRAGDVSRLPALGTPERERLTQIGRARIAAGKVGVVILAGGMATRFGGIVKAAAIAVDGHSFLDLKLRDLRNAAAQCGGKLPAFLMTSFATDDEVTKLAAAADSAAVPLRTFPQFVLLRLAKDGSVFRGDGGEPSPYAPGHGDLPFALRRSGILAAFRAAGGELLYMSNVDNLGATLDPAIIGAHVESGCAITAEVVDKLPGDKGGAPARVGGHLEIVEAFRFPERFDQDTISVFNTNSFVLSAAALERDFPLTWFAVAKKVDDRDAVQFERLVGQLTAFLPTAFLRVERSGEDGRFQPVKDPEELAQRTDEIRAILKSRGAL